MRLFVVEVWQNRMRFFLRKTGVSSFGLTSKLAAAYYFTDRRSASRARFPYDRPNLLAEIFQVAPHEGEMRLFSLDGKLMEKSDEQRSGPGSFSQTSSIESGSQSGEPDDHGDHSAE